MDSDQTMYSTPSGKKHFQKNKKGLKDTDGRYDYINVLREENNYGTFDSSADVKGKDRYTVSNDNYMNAQVNFANCGVCTMIHLCMLILHLLSYILL